MLNLLKDREDLIVSILQQPPFAYNSRICIFEVPVLGSNRIVIVAEQPPEVYEEMVYNWMNTVMAVVNTRHHESVFLICTGLLTLIFYKEFYINYIIY